MNDSVDLTVPPTLTSTEILQWLSVLAKLVESNPGLGMDVVTDVDLGGVLTPNEDWVSIKILLGRCPGRNPPPIKYAVEVVDPPSDGMKLAFKTQQLE